MNDLMKKAIAECIGTFVLVFCACGAAVYIGAVGASIAFGLVIVAMAYSIGRISGCHINPAVSLGCFLAKRMSLKEFLVYVGAQVVGGLVGAVLLFAVMKMSGVGSGSLYDYEDACNYLIGGYTGNASFGNYMAPILVEIVLTCVFVYVILNVTDNNATEGDEYKKGTGQIAGILIGSTLTLVHLMGCGFGGTSVNPARSIATAIANAIFYQETEALKVVWIFILAPLAGAALAAVLYSFLHKSADKTETPAE